MSGQESTHFLTVKDAARQLGIDVRRIRTAIRRGQIPAIALDSRFMVSKKLVERLINGEPMTA